MCDDDDAIDWLRLLFDEIEVDLGDNKWRNSAYILVVDWYICGFGVYIQIYICVIAKTSENRNIYTCEHINGNSHL